MDRGNSLSFSVPAIILPIVFMDGGNSMSFSVPAIILSTVYKYRIEHDIALNILVEIMNFVKYGCGWGRM